MQQLFGCSIFDGSMIIIAPYELFAESVIVPGWVCLSKINTLGFTTVTYKNHPVKLANNCFKKLKISMPAKKIKSESTHCFQYFTKTVSILYHACY